MKQGWEIRKLKELGITQTGTTPKTSEKENFGNDIPFIKPADVDFEGNGKLRYDNDGLSKNGLSKSRKIESNSILMVCIGATIGKVGFSEMDATCNQQINTLTLGKEYFPKFFYYGMTTKGFQDKVLLEGKGAQATLPIINKSKWENLTLPFPKSLPEQQRIVAILDEAFAAIAKAKANAEQNLKNAKELFECVLDSILYDKKWNVKQLGEVCLKVEYGSSTKSTTKGKLPVLRMGNIQNGSFVWNNLVYSDNEEDNEQYLLKHNDVLFNRTNSPELVGKTAIYKSEMPAIFAGYLIRLHRKEDLLDADFLNYYLNSKMAFDYGKTVVISSVNQANINGTKLKTYPIPLPSLEQQQTIVRQLDALRAETQKLEAVYRKKIADLEELKKSILQKAFEGELKTEKVLAI